MAARIVEITDALVLELNAATFSQAFVARRHYLPKFDHQDLEKLQVAVVPRAIVRTVKARAQTKNEIGYEIDIGVLKRLRNTGDDSFAGLLSKIDELTEFVQEITDFGERLRPRTLVNTIVIEVRNDPVFSQEQFEQHRTFHSVVTYVFKVIG